MRRRASAVQRQRRRSGGRAARERRSPAAYLFSLVTFHRLQRGMDERPALFPSIWVLSKRNRVARLAESDATRGPTLSIAASRLQRAVRRTRAWPLRAYFGALVAVFVLGAAAAAAFVHVQADS